MLLCPGIKLPGYRCYLHGLCKRILRIDGRVIGRSNISLYAQFKFGGAGKGQVGIAGKVVPFEFAAGIVGRIVICF